MWPTHSSVLLFHFKLYVVYFLQMSWIWIFQMNVKYHHCRVYKLYECLIFRVCGFVCANDCCYSPSWRTSCGFLSPLCCCPEISTVFSSLSKIKFQMYSHLKIMFQWLPLWPMYGYTFNFLYFYNLFVKLILFSLFKTNHLLNSFKQLLANIAWADIIWFFLHWSTVHRV